MDAYKSIPLNLFIQPNKTISMAVWISLAISRTNNKIPIITMRKERKGSQATEICVLFFNHSATSVESFIAAANPMIIPKKEKMATTKPLRKPLKIANKMRNINTTSMIIFVGFDDDRIGFLCY
jgi:hypothetical protein